MPPNRSSDEQVPRALGPNPLPARRPRVRLACDACKRGKRKCDGSMPACGLCERQARECVYSARNEQPRRSKIKGLELELAELRKRIKQPGETLEDSPIIAEARPQSVSTMSYAQLDILGRPQLSRSAIPERMRHDLSQTAASEFGLSGSMNSNTIALPFRGPMGVYSMSTHYDSDPSTGSVPGACFSEPENDPLVYLQARPVLRVKVTNAFHHRANRYGYFVDPAVYENDDSLLDLPLPLRFLHSTILATGANLAHDPELLVTRSRFAAYAKSMAMPALWSSPGIEVLQGLIILAWLDMANGDGLQMLVYNSLAGSLVTYLGLDVKNPTLLRSDELADTQNKTQVRTFWAHVFNDRTISAAFGKLPGIRWRHVQTPQYCAMSTVGTWTPTDLYFDTTCRLWRLFDTVMDDIYAPSFKDLSQTARNRVTHHCEDRLRELYSETDPRIKLQSNTSKELPEAYYLHIAFHTAIILLNRPLLEQGMTDDHQRTLQTMAKSANAICKAIQRYCKDYSFADSPPYLVFHITRACVVFLLIATSSTVAMQRSAANGLKHCLKAIDQCTQAWYHLGDRSIRLIKELASRWQVVKSLPLHYSNVSHDFHNANSSQADSMNKPDIGWPYQENIEHDLSMYDEFMWSDINPMGFE